MSTSPDYVLTPTEFHFVQQKLQGDCILQARVELADGAKAGWVVRRTPDDAAGQIELIATHDDQVIQLERRGNTFTASTARWGEPFTTRDLAASTDVGAEPSIGLFSSARGNE